MPRSSSRNSPGRRNFMAACVTLFSFGILYSSFDPVPAGEEITIRRPAPAPVFETALVPLPPEARDIAGALEDVAPAAEPELVTIEDFASSESLDNQQSLYFCLQLLKNGARFIEGIKVYTVVFHREERINGDMKTPQSINMKVQHSPHFAVYMKWLTGTRGQQVLYSDAYEDRCMVVKFGGFKRLLPALRVDPNCSSAKAESRYPVTEAGILKMIHQILAFREKDLERGHGLTCVRLKDQEFDGRNCFCFQLDYESPEISKVYRKSLFMIDAERHVPLLVRNFTWATESTDLSAEELDKSTMIENYSFTNLDFTRELLAKEFSRDNPPYRM